MPVDPEHYRAKQADAAGPMPAAEAGWQPVHYDDRNDLGQWPKGTSGNPAGRPKGSRNRATLMAEALLDGAVSTLVGKAIEQALAGDSVALRFCLARIIAPRRGAPVDLDLAALDTQQDLALALSAVVKAATAGDITPEQARDLAQVIGAARRAIEARDAEFRENHFWGRQRSPAAPPLPAAAPDRDPG